MAYYIILSILSPVILFKGITVGLLDFLPIIFLIHIVLTKKTKISFTPKVRLFFKLAIFLFSIWFISTIISILIHFDFISSVKSMLQLYRRFTAILIVPLYFIYLKEDYNLNNLIKILSKLIIVIGVGFELINFSPQVRDFYMGYISNSEQTVHGLFFRNMGFIGEPTYFATLLSIIILANIFLANYKNKAIYMLLLFIILLSTFSKSVIFSFLFVLILIVMSKRILVRIFIFLLMMTPIIIMIYNLYFTTFLEQYFVGDAYTSLDDRVDHIWIHSINIFSSNYLNYFFGLGTKGLKSYYNMEGVHNNYLAFIVDFGFIGGILSIILLLFIIPYNVNNKSKFLMSISVLLMIISIVHEPLYHSSILALLFFFYILVLKYHIYKGVKIEKSINP